jgi:hypothetical protein
MTALAVLPRILAVLDGPTTSETRTGNPGLAKTAVRGAGRDAG